MKQILFAISLLFALPCFSQNNQTLKPLLLDKSALSGVGLKAIEMKDEPGKIFHQKNLYRGEDISVYVVSTNSYNNKMENFSIDEFVYMFHGEAFVKPNIGKSQHFHSGDYFFAPKGFSGEWEILAGKHLHYELSVITTERASTNSSNLRHSLFNKSILSGTQIDLTEESKHSEILREGVELSVTLNAERPSETPLNNAKEQMIQLLSGQISITDRENITQTFYTGDFFVIPKGFNGKWVSQGHGIVKYLAVEKSY
ncbi:MAG: cupin domain-containing protein [Bacteroidota bacterium]